MELHRTHKPVQHRGQINGSEKYVVLYDMIYSQWTKKITVEGSTKGKKRGKMNSEKLIGIVVNGTTVSEVSDHILDRMEDRSVSLDAVRDALEHPLETKPVKYGDQGRPSFAVVGEKATVSINPDTGKLTTTYPTHSKTVQKLKHRKERET